MARDLILVVYILWIRSRNLVLRNVYKIRSNVGCYFIFLGIKCLPESDARSDLAHAIYLWGGYYTEQAKLERNRSFNV